MRWYAIAYAPEIKLLPCVWIEVFKTYNSYYYRWHWQIRLSAGWLKFAAGFGPDFIIQLPPRISHEN